MHTVHGSAKIYQFPTRIRSENDVRRAQAQADAMRAAELPYVEFGSGWYHEAAIEDDAPKPAPQNVTPLVRH